MKTLIYTTAVNTINRTVKDTEIFDVTRRTWEHYCKRHNMDFYVIDTPPLKEDTPPHWFRYWIFDLKPNYDRYMYIDTDIMAKWDAPNIFEGLDEKEIYAVKDNSGLSWIWEGIQGYQTMFPDTYLDWDRYFNSGVLVFSKHHKELFNDFKEFFVNNRPIIDDYRNRFRKGHDQTIFNYFTTWYEQPVQLISEKWNLFHMIRREILFNGYFSQMGYFWHFNNVDRTQQTSVINQVWDTFKKNYE